jgi:copper chaperone CopZ
LEKTVPVENIHCNHCVMAIRREVSVIAGVQSVQVDPESKTVTVKWDAPATWDQVVGMLREIGYPPTE